MEFKMPEGFTIPTNTPPGLEPLSRQQTRRIFFEKGYAELNKTFKEGRRDKRSLSKKLAKDAWKQRDKS